MRWIKHLVLLLALLAVCPLPAQDIENKLREGMASARLTAAHTVPAVTAAQCSALLADWQEKTKSDGAPSKGRTNYWDAGLSTEELTRLFQMAFACEQESYQRYRRQANYGDAFPLAMYALQFQTQLLFRSESVLRDHQLVEEYLLQP